MKNAEEGGVPPGVPYGYGYMVVVGAGSCRCIDDENKNKIHKEGILIHV